MKEDKKLLTKYDVEYQKIAQSEYYYRKVELESAPKFREYIRMLLDNVDLTEKQLYTKKRTEYMRVYNRKKSREKKDNKN